MAEAGGCGGWVSPAAVPIKKAVVDLDANMRDASQRWNPFWFYRRVRRGGPWDFRRLTEVDRWYGNFHYASVGTAFGFPAWCLLRGAGWEHWWSGRSRRVWGRPWAQAPHGDHPEDQANILVGIAYARDRGYRQGIGGRLFWRAFDIMVALFGLLVLGPITALLALLTLADSGRPALNGSWRLGRYGRPFRCWKIRTLRTDHQRILIEHLFQDAAARAEWNRHAKLSNDPRVTRVGRVLRATSLDDIGPQCWNILVGDMAVFGPRAFLISEEGRLAKDREAILSVTPGWVSYYGAYGRARLTVEQRVRLDARFAKTMYNPSVKWRALVGTIWHCLRRTGAG